MINTNHLFEVTEILKRDYAPAKIILFGSHAKNVATADSDVDLALIFKELPNSNKIELIKEILQSLNGISIPLDIFVYSEQEFQESSKQFGSAAEIIASEGRVL